ncbi:MAG: phosphatase PAP2 family protein [Anaerolineales bacterium]
MLLMTAGINELTKLSLRRPRPYWIKPDALITTPSGGYGLPSGHAQQSISVYGLLAIILKKHWITLSSVFIIFMIGLSRVYLGEHFITDVLFGWLVGGVVLYAFVRLEPKVQRWFSQKSFTAKTLTVFGVTVAFSLLSILVVSIPAGYHVPQEWADNALIAFPGEKIAPLNPNNLITSMATLFGFSVGYFWIETLGGFNTSSESWWKRALRFVIGLIGVVIFWMGLGAVFPDDPKLLGWGLRFLRYSLVGFWLTGLAPFLFLRFGLAQPKDQ